MTLLLDRRHRAMLQEMGIRVWSPAPTAAIRPSPATATPAIDATAIEVPAAEIATAPWIKPHTPVATLPPASAVALPPATPPQPVRSASAPAAPLPQPLAVAPAPAVQRESLSVSSTVLTGIETGATLSPARPYGKDASADATLPPPHTAWLLIVEGTSLRGDAGRLLDSLLHAIQLPADIPVWICLAHLQTDIASAAESESTIAVVPPWQLLQPRCVMVLGRTAARAALGSTTPLDQLRSRIHPLASAAAEVPAMVSYDPSYLLRAPRSRAKAWQDWCQAKAATLSKATPSTGA